MTNPAPTENERIALLRGWIKDVCPFTGHDAWTWMGDVPWMNDPPDFLHEWEHAGPLLSEIIRGLGDSDELHLGTDWLSLNGVIYSAEENVYGTPGWPNTGLTEAISHAWLAWKEEDK